MGIFIKLGTVTAETMLTLISMVKAGQSLTGVDIEATVMPLVLIVQSVFTIEIPGGLVTDISSATATAINKYIFGK